LAPFSKTLSICSSFVMRDQVSHPCKTASNVIVLYTVQPRYIATVCSVQFVAVNRNSI